MKYPKFILFILIIVLVLLVSYIIISYNTKTKFITCKENQNADSCIEIYKPVCGYVQVDCIKEPCDLQTQTFSNSCFACSNNRVKYYTGGECS